MRVGISYPGAHRKGGVERVMLECLNYLAAEGHETHGFASDWEPGGVDERVFRHVVNSCKWPGFLSTPSFVKECGREMRASGVGLDVNLGFGAAAQPGSVMWMQSVHAAWIEICEKKRDFRGRLKQRLNPFHTVILRRERRLIGDRQYRKIVALTETVRDDVMRIYGVPERDIVIIPNGYAPDEFNVQKAGHLRESMRARLGYSDRDRVVVFVANELDRKGFFPLLEALARMDDPSLRLLAVGRLNPDACTTALHRLRWKDRVTFTGPTGSAADYFSAADIFALPTQYEAWGLVIIEAMACGLPVLTSRLAGAAVAVEEGKTGVLLDDPADIEEIARGLNALLGSRNIAPGQIEESVHQYRWSKVLGRLEQTLETSSN